MDTKGFAQVMRTAAYELRKHEKSFKKETTGVVTQQLKIALHDLHDQEAINK